MLCTDSLDHAHALIGEQPTAVTFGVFDGVHLGHQELIHRTVDWAQARGGLAVALTFHEHPLHLLAPVYAPPRLTSARQQVTLLESLGLNLLVTVEFSQDFADQSPEEFVRGALLGRLRAGAVILGFNNRFGKGGSGDTAVLQRLSRESGFEAIVIPPRRWKDSVVSSTRVRQLLLDGRVDKANELLGRHHMLEGTVTMGDARGKRLAFPTANLHLDANTLIPCTGVYAVQAQVGEETRGGMMNIGHRPTFGGETLQVEVHLFDFEQEIYGERLCVQMLRRLRSERRFSSADELTAQLRRDREQALAVLAAGGEDAPR